MREPKVWLVIKSGLGNLLVRNESVTLPEDTYVAGPFRYFEAQDRREEEEKKRVRRARSQLFSFRVKLGILCWHDRDNSGSVDSPINRSCRQLCSSGLNRQCCANRRWLRTSGQLPE